MMDTFTGERLSLGQCLLWAGGGVLILVVVFSCAMLIVLGIGRLFPRILGAPKMLVWGTVEARELRAAIAEQCRIQALAGDTVAVDGPIDLQELAESINTKLKRTA